MVLKAAICNASFSSLIQDRDIRLSLLTKSNTLDKPVAPTLRFMIHLGGGGNTVGFRRSANDFT